MDDTRIITDQDGNEITIVAVRRPGKTKTMPDGTTKEVPGFISHFVDSEGKSYFPTGPTSVSDGEEEFTVKQL